MLDPGSLNVQKLFDYFFADRFLIVVPFIALKFKYLRIQTFILHY